MLDCRIVEPGEVRDPKKNYRVDITDGTLYEVHFENAVSAVVGSPVPDGQEDSFDREPESDPLGR